jgi:hypothetical protein
MQGTDNSRGGAIRALVVRLVITGIAVALWLWTQSLIGRRHFPSSGIGDALHSLTAPLNHYLVLHPTAANGVLITSSGLIDVAAIFVFAEWVFGHSVRPLLGLAILLGLRQVAQALCALPEPEGLIWHYPGFPSLLVTYGVSNDFFFSAHTAIAVFAATEIARLGRCRLPRRTDFAAARSAVGEVPGSCLELAWMASTADEGVGEERQSKVDNMLTVRLR